MLSLKQDFVNARTLRQKLGPLLDRVEAGGPLVVTREGVPAVVIVSAEMYDQLIAGQQDRQAANFAYHKAMADAARARADRGEAITGEEFRSELAGLIGEEPLDFTKVDPYQYVDLEG